MGALKGVFEFPFTRSFFVIIHMCLKFSDFLTVQFTALDVCFFILWQHPQRLESFKEIIQITVQKTLRKENI